MHKRLKIDYWLLVPVVVLIVISLTTLLSVSRSFFQGQLFSLIAGLLAFFFFSQIDIDVLKQFKLPIYIIGIILLGIILLLGIESHGAVRWLTVLGLSIQFSEILKPFFSLAFAAFLAERQFQKKRSFFLTLLLLLPIILLINFQPDLGSALIYAATSGFVLLVAGFPLWWFGLAILPLVLISPILWSMLHVYQRERILTFLHPAHDPLGTSYNAIQAVIAIGSGSWFGKGLSEGTQSGLRFLPERQTDFIFATVAEGLGFVGAGIVILSVLLLGYRIYIIFRNSPDSFTKFFTACTFGFLVLQAIVNIGMNLSILPIVGVTLPFVSFGGSSLVASFIFLGLLSSLSTSQHNKHVLEIR